MNGMRTVLAVLVVGAASAQMTSVPGWFLSGLNRAFQLTLDHETYHSGQFSARIECPEQKCADFATVMQTIRSFHYLEKRVRLSAWVKADKGVRAARMWMRIDGVDGSVLGFDNMESRGKKGPFGWTLQKIVLKVPRDAALINFGLIVAGEGTAWLDDVTFVVVPKNTRTTNTRGPSPVPSGEAVRYANVMRDVYLKSKYEPVNLDFETAP